MTMTPRSEKTEIPTSESTLISREENGGIGRRGFLAATAGVGGWAFGNRAGVSGGNVIEGETVVATASRAEPPVEVTAEVFVAKAASYDADLVGIIGRGLVELGLDLKFAKGKSILLKPNLVEPSRQAPHINTHPLFLRAVIEVFRQWDAREVFVAEGQGHCRDTDYVLEQSGLGAILDEAKTAFVDLNHDDVFVRRNSLGATRLTELHLPRTLRRADIIVSLPKMKTHHWAGVTLSMKNLFGVMPGVIYGWPKNVLHYQGIPRAILDITATVAPHLAIVDGIVGMEGDGPIMGTPKNAGVIVMGQNLPAVDATAARIMDLDPMRIWYLAAAEGRLGTVAEANIQQRGETVPSVKTRFELLKHLSMRVFRDDD